MQSTLPSNGLGFTAFSYNPDVSSPHPAELVTVQERGVPPASTNGGKSSNCRRSSACSRSAGREASGAVQGSRREMIHLTPSIPTEPIVLVANRGRSPRKRLSNLPLAPSKLCLTTMRFPSRQRWCARLRSFFSGAGALLGSME